VTERSPSPPDLEPLTRSQILIGMGCTAVFLMLASKLWMHWGSVALLPTVLSGEALGLGLGLGLAITGASSVIYRIWGAYRRNADYYLRLVLEPLAWSDLLWLGLLPGMSEELLFRGVMLPALGANWEAVVLSSICFGVLHLSSPKQWAYVIWAMIIGGVLGASALVTGNLFVPIVAHIFTNILSSVLWKWDERVPG
jgi:uncharacterized protein